MGQVLMVITATAAVVGLQSAVMFVDELVYHRRRKLGLFESIGHPVDSAVFLSAVAVPALAAPGAGPTAVYALLSLLSLIVITKDEWVHARECEPTEHWLHAVLFVLHAPVLFGVFFTWQAAPASLLLKVLPLTVGGWMTYQITYWMDYHVRRKHRAPHPAGQGAPADGGPPGQQRLLRRAGGPLV